ncbi:MAG: hypothetical protein JST12_07695 [Armatimonadetes bacterium]|nr:hypothetical protein [Armatimonadota bacterium]
MTSILQTQTGQSPSLQVVGNKINVTIGKKMESVDATVDPSKEAPADHVAYRRDKMWAVWDSRGLTVRNGEKLFSTKLGDIAVSPRAFAREDILKTLDLFKAKQRTKECDSLSGSVRIGTKCYFLPRWTQKDGTTWLEALIVVDFADETLKPKFLGRFMGFSTANQKIDDKMFTVKDQLSIVTKQGDTWGLSSFNADQTTFDFNPLGSNLVSYYRGGYFLETTSYGTSIVGQIDLASGLRKNLFETRAKNVELSDGSYLAILRSKDNTVIKNLKTGGQVMHAANAYVEPLDNYVLVWTKNTRTTAWLYEPTRWTAIATGAN